MKSTILLSALVCAFAATEVIAGPNGGSSGFERVRRSHKAMDHARRAAAAASSDRKATTSIAKTTALARAAAIKTTSTKSTSTKAAATSSTKPASSSSKVSTSTKAAATSSSKLVSSSSPPVNVKALSSSAVSSSAASSSSSKASSLAVSSSANSTAAIAARSSTVTSSAIPVASTDTVVLNVAPNPNFLQGLNLGGFDFGIDTQGNSRGYATPPVSQIPHFSNQGVNVYRIPFGWQYMQPTLGGPIDAGFFAKYDAVVQAALQAGAYVILDCHNYARWNGAIIGQTAGGPTDEQFVNLWTQLATKYAGVQKIMFGIMNEPHTLDMTLWTATLQKVVNAIRAAGATSQTLLIPGTVYSSGGAFPKQSYPFLKTITDPQGGTDKLVFDLHQYLDGAGTGKDPECTTNNLGNFAYIYNSIAPDGRKAFLSETGGGDTDSCKQMLLEQLAYLLKRSDVFTGFTTWSAGAFSPTYALSMTPTVQSNGTLADAPLWIKAVKPVLKAGGLAPQ